MSSKNVYFPFIYMIVSNRNKTFFGRYTDARQNYFRYDQWWSFLSAFFISV